ncbi:MAG: DUF4010 domain-containing protein [Fibrobacteraceae bacterium]
MELNSFYRLACALVLGFIIGLQREHAFQSSENHPAGIRTFAITGLAGGIAAFLSELMNSPLPFVAILLVLGILLALSHYAAFRMQPNEQPGLTTSVAMIAVYLLGALCWYGKIIESTAMSIAILWLLTIKDQLHDFAKKISKEDLLATLKFALISAVILPILPEKGYGPPGLEVLSPYKIWLFVVFISGISFIGYVLIKWIGPGKGIGITGLFGGLASSTALTLSLSQRSKDNPGYSRSLTMGVVIAWSVMYWRLYLICIVLQPSLAGGLALPLLIPPLPGLAYAWYLRCKDQKFHSVQASNYTNPFELLPALKFGAVFAVVLFVASAAQKYFGSSALFLSSFITGFADMDAITLSLLEMMKQGTVIAAPACLAIAIASVANTLCKGALVCIFGDNGMRKAILPAILIFSATSLAIILFAM